MLALALLSLACNPGAYPVDIFTEMHYQASQRRLEPPRLAPVAEAVPVQGRGRRPETLLASGIAPAAQPAETTSALSFAEAATLRNPVPATAETSQRGGELYRVNCAACHGSSGRGDGPVAAYFGRVPQAPVPPADLTSGHVQERSDGQLYWILTHGLGNMPPFGDLLTDQERWLLVHAVRQFQGQP